MRSTVTGKAPGFKLNRKGREKSGSVRPQLPQIIKPTQPFVGVPPADAGVDRLDRAG